MGKDVHQAMIETLKLMEKEVILPCNNLVSNTQQPHSPLLVPHTSIAVSVGGEQIVETNEQANEATHPSPSDIELAAPSHLVCDSVTVPSPVIELTGNPRCDPTLACTNTEPTSLPISSNDQSQYNMIVEDFLESLETPIQQPIIQGEFQMSQTQTEEEPADLSLKSTQRKSSRLAKKRLS
jgi:hypothetical protein